MLDLVGVHIELLGLLHQRKLTSDGGKCHLRLESRAMVPARSSCSWYLSRIQAEIPLILVVQIPEPALSDNPFNERTASNDRKWDIIE